ncbi:hypothetical protein M201_gp70 [Haloarcula californiae tailed virus 2]|uniref:Uncharacterized protein n=1 Tax=Haloarcula californiae tailed virus 2 TaxID=1273747 RepID=R4TM87_9CAUD|nr:hypothetical protein M201_gp70 [Haloarcula californiae tailed virus 2]AGM11837.1 hypothetical protein HCTV2_68 [Haloarcula californiae tailed virus 2]
MSEGEDLPDPEDMSTDEMLELMDEDPEAAERLREQQEQQGQDEKPGSRGGETPVLWVSLTSAGRGAMDQESMAELQDWLDEQLGDRYDIVVADDRVRLLDREDALNAIQDLQEYAAQFSNEEALFQAATGDDEQE